MRNFSLIIMFQLLLYSCYTIIDEEIGSTNNFIVDAAITDENKLHHINLSELNKDGEQLPLREALIQIESKSGELYTFRHWFNGDYTFLGEFPTDSQYRLLIELENDRITSDWQFFPGDGGTIDSLFFDRSKLFFVDRQGNEQSKEQVEFLINFQTDSEYYALLDYYGIYEVTSVPIESLGPPPVCWVSEFSFNYLNPVSIRTGRQPFLLRSDFSDTKFRKYNLVIEQFIIDEQAFNFWDKQNRLRLLSGNIFDPIPFSIDGNLSLQEDTKRVFGFFTLARYSSKRFAFDSEDLPFLEPFSSCELDFIDDGEVELPQCADCTLLEFAVDERPLDWIEP